MLERSHEKMCSANIALTKDLVIEVGSESNDFWITEPFKGLENTPVLLLHSCRRSLKNWVALPRLFLLSANSYEQNSCVNLKSIWAVTGASGSTTRRPSVFEYKRSLQGSTLAQVYHLLGDDYLCHTRYVLYSLESTIGVAQCSPNVLSAREILPQNQHNGPNNTQRRLFADDRLLLEQHTGLSFMQPLYKWSLLSQSRLAHTPPCNSVCARDS